MTKEPSMEEILSSIKRIIAEEGDEASRGISARAPKRGKPAEDTSQATDIEGRDVIETVSLASYARPEEVLELTEALDPAGPAAHSEEPLAAPSVTPASPPAPEANVMARTAIKPAPESVAAGTVAPEAIAAENPAPKSGAAETMLSVESEVATRHSLSALSAMVVKPQEGGRDNTLESLVRELLRPMMKDWLDAHLPDLVEAMVAKEIARITGRAL
nr:DUF2497 domain-containing protein [Sphingobium algorifonticola]